MISCPNCNHQNPEGANQCEACYTPLLSASGCPKCGALVQMDAKFCGRCGFGLDEATGFDGSSLLGSLEEMSANLPIGLSDAFAESPSITRPLSVTTPPLTEPFLPAISVTPAAVSTPMTQLQICTTQLFHVQSNKIIEIPPHLTVIHIGKPNDRVKPDIDVSGLAHSNIVSRTHADIRREGDTYYIEDTGSSNGTYINSTPLSVGNRHRLKPGDRISLGKGDLVTFLFQYSQS
jgi:ribosomal protein L40E